MTMSKDLGNASMSVGNVLGTPTRRCRCSLQSRLEYGVGRTGLVKGKHPVIGGL